MENCSQSIPAHGFLSSLAYILIKYIQGIYKKTYS